MKKYLKAYILGIVLCLSIVLWLIAVMVKASRTEGDQILYREGAYYNCAEGWYDDSGNAVNLEKLVFKKSDVLKTKIYHYRIPEEFELGESDSICFFCRGIDFNVYVTAPVDSSFFDSPEFGSRKLYEFNQNSANLSGQDIGLTLQTIPIYRSDKENIITIEITPTEYSAFILDMRIQKTSEFILSTLRSRIPIFVESIFILFFGLATIIYTIFAIEEKRERKIPFYAWGAASLIIGILLVIQTQVLQILTGRPEFYSTLKYLLALLLGYPLSVQTDSVAKVPHKHYSHVIGFVVCGLILVETAGNFFFNVSLYRLFYISALILIFNQVVNCLLIVKEIRFCKKNKLNFYSVYMLLAVTFIFVFSVIDFSLYLKAARHLTDWGRIIRHAYFIFIIVMLIVFLRTAIKRNHQAMLAEKYRLESRTDALSGLPNKAAYIDKQAELANNILASQEKGDSDFSFVIVSLDLNNLKKVNDNLGHDMGDRFIQQAAQVLKESVAGMGEAYRVGGDEFLALIYSDDLENSYQDMIKKLNDKIDNMNENEKHDFPLSFAYGHAICSSTQTPSIHDCEKLADKEMYDCKHRMKAER